MYARTIALVFAGATLAATAAYAGERTVIHEDGPPAVVVTPPPLPGVRVERKSVETTWRGDCRSKTVHKEDEAGSTTVHKEQCD